MSKTFTAIFKLTDQVSNAMERISNAGVQAIRQWENVGQATGEVFDGLVSSATTTAQSLGDLTGDISNFQNGMTGAAESINECENAIDSYARETERTNESIDSLISAGQATENALSAQARAADEAAEHIEDYAEAIDTYARNSERAEASMDGFANAGQTTENALNAQSRAIEETARRMESYAGAADQYARNSERAATSMNGFSSANRASQTVLNAQARATDEAARRVENYAEVLGDYEQAVDQTAASIEELTNAGQTSQEALELHARAANEVAESINECENAIDSYARETERTNESIDDLTGASRESEEALEEQARAADEAAERIEDYAEETEEATENSEEFGDESANAIQDLSQLLMSAGIVEGVKEIGQAFLDASDAAGEFEVATAKIVSIADTSKTSMSTISSDLKDLSAVTGEAVGDLSDAAYEAISASVDTASAVDFTGTATKLAVGGFTSAATAVDVLTTAINAYGLSAADAENISDMLIVTQNLGKTSVDQLAQSVGKVIPLAAAYNMEMDNLSAAYAELTKGGIATAEAGTYLKGMLSELGDSGSIVSGVLVEETGYAFAQLMEQGYSLGDVLNILGESVDGDSTKFTELWSGIEAGIGALALFNAGADQFNATLEETRNSVGITAQAYETMTDTTVHAQQEMTNASKNLQIAIGEDLNPIMESMYDMGTKAFNWATDIVEEHPAVTAAISAIAVAVGVVAVAVSGFALVTCPTVVAAINTVKAAMLANPIFLIVTGVVALTAAVVAFTSVLVSQESEYESWTASTKQQYDELQSLNAEYEEACEKYGETSEAASRLKYEMDELNAEFIANKQTVEEFTTECDALVESHAKLMEEYESSANSLKEEELGTLALIQKLEDLASQNVETAGTHEQMEAIIAELNAQLPELALSYDQVTESTEATVEAIRKAAEAQAEEERRIEQQETYVKLLKDQAALEEQVAKARENLELSQESDSNAGFFTDAWFYNNTGWLGSWATDTDEYTKALEELEIALAETNTAIKEIEADYAAIAEATKEAAEQTVSYEDAVNAAFSSAEAKVTELVDAYNLAYETARTSIDGQIGLFDTMKVKSETSTKEMIAALESQTDYLNTYTENLQKATDFGLDEGLISSLADGSEESAAYLDTIIGKIEKLGGSTDAAKQFIDEMNTSFNEVEEAKDSFANAIAEMETNFTERMDAIELEMQDTIANLNMETDAAAAATSTIQAYAAAIEAQKGSAIEAALQVAAAVEGALSSSSTPTVGKPAVTVPGHATGTTNAEDVFIAGEDGPELIIGREGSTVFPAEETERILGAVREQPLRVAPPTDFGSTAKETQRESQTASSEKKITLEIAGSGAIEAGGSNKEQILDVLISNIKPVLMNIIQAEIYEEGELSYEF